MAREVILDTGIIVESERNGLELESVIGDGDPAVAAVTAMELLVGVNTWKPDLRDERGVLIEGILASMLIEDYTLKVARMHALLHNHVRRIGDREARSTSSLPRHHCRDRCCQWPNTDHCRQGCCFPRVARSQGGGCGD